MRQLFSFDALLTFMENCVQLVLAKFIWEFYRTHLLSGLTQCLIMHLLPLHLAAEVSVFPWAHHRLSSRPCRLSHRVLKSVKIFVHDWELYKVVHLGGLKVGLDVDVFVAIWLGLRVEPFESVSHALDRLEHLGDIIMSVPRNLVSLGSINSWLGLVELIPLLDCAFYVDSRMIDSQKVLGTVSLVMHVCIARSIWCFGVNRNVFIVKLSVDNRVRLVYGLKGGFGLDIHEVVLIVILIAWFVKGDKRLTKLVNFLTHLAVYCPVLTCKRSVALHSDLCHLLSVLFEFHVSLVFLFLYLKLDLAHNDSHKYAGRQLLGDVLEDEYRFIKHILFIDLMVEESKFRITDDWFCVSFLQNSSLSLDFVFNELLHVLW